MKRFLSKTIASAFTWVASSDLQVDLPKEGLITQIAFRFAITMSAALTAVQPDGLRRVIQNLKIDSGGLSFLGASGEQMGRLLSLLNLQEGLGNLVTLPEGTVESLTYVFHPGSNPRDPFDMSAVIPAQDLGELKATWTTTANSVVDDTTTISSGTCKVSVWYVTGVDKVNGKTPGIMIPMLDSLTNTHAANYADLTNEISVPTGAYLRRIAMLVQDETATRPVRKDDEVTRVGLYGDNRRLLDLDWEALKAQAAAEGGMQIAPFQVADGYTGHAGMPDGFAVIDLRKIGHPLYGLDLRKASKEDIKLLTTIENYTGGDDTILLFDRVKPWAEV